MGKRKTPYEDYSGNFDKVLQTIGPFGLYQRLRFIILCIAAGFPLSWWMTSQVFLILAPKHHCTLPSREGLPYALANLSQEDYRSLFIPLEYDEVTRGYVPSKCLIRNTDEVLLAWDDTISGDSGVGNVQDFLVSMSSRSSNETCDSWDYYDPADKWSIVNEWNMVCHRNYMPNLMLTISSVGGIFGTLGFAVMQDKIGRRPTFMIALTWYTVFGAISSFMPTFEAYLGIVIFRSMSGISLFQIPYVTALEFVTSQYNAVVVNSMSIAYGLGLVSMALICWVLQTWQQIIWVNVFSFTPLIVYWFIIDESPRWLLSQGKKEKALDIIMKMARQNKCYISRAQMADIILPSVPGEDTGVSGPRQSLLLPGSRTENGHHHYDDGDEQKRSASISNRRESLLEVAAHKLKKNPNLWTLFMHKNLFFFILSMAFLWSANAMVYVGLSYNTENFGGNPYLIYIFISLVELPADFFNFSVNYIGRIWPTAATMAMGGIALLSASFTPPHIIWLVWLLVIVSKFCITSSFCIVYQIGGELMPTPLRGTGIGFATMVSQVLGLLTPFIIYSNTIFRQLPMIILGSLSFAGGIVTLFLPETLNRRIPDTVEDTVAMPGFGVRTLIRNLTCRSVREQRKWTLFYTDDDKTMKMTETMGAGKDTLGATKDTFIAAENDPQQSPTSPENGDDPTVVDDPTIVVNV